ncbi:hypothetical protein DFS34DRAFT_648683 [Phlyctochytrium arcticum]|nr:hypothetical protein DFS34DRAFT_648683 [Phlyctochytrium arcticum]
MNPKPQTTRELLSKIISNDRRVPRMSARISKHAPNSQPSKANPVDSAATLQPARPRQPPEPKQSSLTAFLESTMSFGSPSTSRTRQADQERLLEQSNDDHVGALHSKISALKHVSMDIHDDVLEDHRRMDSLSDTFEQTRVSLATSMKRLTVMVNTRYGANTCRTVGLVVGAVMLLWILARLFGGGKDE